MDIKALPRDKMDREIYKFLQSIGWESFDQCLLRTGFTPFAHFPDCLSFMTESGEGFASPLFIKYPENCYQIFDSNGMRCYDENFKITQKFI